MPVVRVDVLPVRIKITTDAPLAPTALVIGDLVFATSRMARAVSLSRILVRRVSALPEYSYRINAGDGRVWRQTIRYVSEGVLRMTFNVPDFWTVAEFSPHRLLRDKVLLDLIQFYGLEELDAVFN